VERPEVLVESREEWRAWLEANHEQSAGIWLVRWKKPSGRPHVAYADVVEEALCFGWIDSQARGIDDERAALTMTPRKKGSGWSKVNKERIARLEAADLMAPAGRALIAQAKEDGSWAKLDAVEKLEEPDDLCTALDGVPDARRHWDAFPRSTKRAILEWIGSAKKPETRERRVEQTAQEAGQNIRANQPRQTTGKIRR
jgi:uncharacterized protein YdeI (YjbR/CyaY-like superfamily)